MSYKEWSEDFQSMLKSTEKNISSIKRHLQDKPRQKSMFSSSGIDSFLFANSSSTTNNHLTSTLTTSSRMSAPPLTSQTTLLTSMFNRLEGQTKTITHLTETVQLQTVELQKVKDHQNDLENRLRGNNLTNMGRKIDSIQRELRSEMESLQTMIQDISESYNRNTYSGNGYDVSRDIKLQKRMIEDEINSLRREVDSLKNRLTKIECEMINISRDRQDYSRKWSNAERDISTMANYQRQHQRVTDRKDNELQYLENELVHISNMVSELHHPKISKDSNHHHGRSHVNKREDKRTNENYFDNNSSPLSTILSNSSEIDLSLESLSDKKTVNQDVEDNNDLFLESLNLSKEKNKDDNDDLFLDTDTTFYYDIDVLKDKLISNSKTDLSFADDDFSLSHILDNDDDILRDAELL